MELGKIGISNQNFVIFFIEKLIIFLYLLKKPSADIRSPVARNELSNNVEIEKLGQL